MRHLKPVLAALAGIAMLGSAGCLVGADLINRDLLLQLGFDPNTIQPPSGSVVVVFVNDTNRQAEFQFYQADDATSLAAGVKTIQAAVPPGSTSNEVLRCPTTLVSLGQIDAAFAANQVGALVFTDTTTNAAGTAVNYLGSPLREGLDYSCGDLIEFRLVRDANAAQGQEAFILQVIVRPGL
ncbi:MAG: hypothetical protein CHACPFDD_00533 [Phycisphaerae bacterium]|nr:hypothetical protein [Phycisphaerae bacterium]